MSKCPQCGKELNTITDKCPVCGCDFQNFFKQEKEQFEKDWRIRAAYKSISIPEKPCKKMLGITKVAIVFFIIVVSLCTIVGLLDKTSDGVFGILKNTVCIWGSCALIAAFSASYNNNRYEKKLEEYNLFQKNPEEYKIRKAKERMVQNTHSTILEMPTQKQLTITCPYCKSTNVKKITTANRIAGAAVMGLASSNIGNQWYCNNCKSKF